MEQVHAELITVRTSHIHGTGIFAATRILRGTRITQYIGEKVSKEEGTRREELQCKTAKEGAATVFVFELDDKWDIDGKVPENTARFINHSCMPNCEVLFENGEIWIVAQQDISTGEELSYDYGFDLENFEKYPCKCGKPNCVGYMVAQEHWSALKTLLKTRR